MLQEYLKRTWSISVLDHLASQLGENWGQDQPTGGIQWGRGICCGTRSPLNSTPLVLDTREMEKEIHNIQMLKKHSDDGHNKLRTQASVLNQ